MDTKNLNSMLVNARSYDAELVLWDRIQAKRARSHIKVGVRRLKRRERAAWRADMLVDDTQAFEAFEDRERILDHISDTFWYGVDETSREFVFRSLHHPSDHEYEFIVLAMWDDMEVAA